MTHCPSTLKNLVPGPDQCRLPAQVTQVRQRHTGGRWAATSREVHCCVHYSSRTSREYIQGARAGPPPGWSAAPAAAAACVP